MEWISSAHESCQSLFSWRNVVISLGVAKSPAFAWASKLIDSSGRIQSWGQLWKTGLSEWDIVIQVLSHAASPLRWTIGWYFDRFFFSASIGGMVVKIRPRKYRLSSNPLLWLLQQNSVVKASAIVNKAGSSNSTVTEKNKASNNYHWGAYHHFDPWPLSFGRREK